jgi:hypothetical protein
MAQTMFNPRNMEEYDDEGYFLMYEDTAFSKMATQDERDDEEYVGIWPFGREYETAGRINNRGSITARIERHQGIDDDTQAVNRSFNNSSIIVGVPAPPPLEPYYPEFRDRSCFLEETFTNPGDDLIGAKMKGEMLFTESFTYDAKGRPITPSEYKIGTSYCTDDGGSFEIPYEAQDIYSDEQCKYDCCAGAGNCTVEKWSMSGCTEALTPGECGSLASCITSEGGQLKIYCCNQRGGCVPPETVDVNCGTLPEVRLPVSADANIFNKSPLIEYINNTILEGEDSLFRRFMPRIESLFEFEDTPTKTPFGATVSVIDFGTTFPGSFRLEYADGQVAAPEMYIPHLGTLYKNWLVEFQKALKPFTFSTVTESVDRIDPPIPGGGDCSGGTGVYQCDQYEEALIGHCSVNNLEQYFTGPDAHDKACLASKICNRESGGYPQALNSGCVNGSSCDYSAGLFQYNLIIPNRCVDDQGRFGIVAYDCDPTIYCTIGNQTTLDACVAHQWVPENAINTMIALSGGGDNWCPWQIRRGCVICDY